jgi:alanyl-tRNA synthetase
VGITARHGTYFEMLGNFSFGDYFKTEATAWAWEFFTKTLEIPEELLYVSVYEKDDEAFDIWTQKVGVAPDHMVRLGKEDNFWEHGSGPCGPCSEIYVDRGPEKGCGKPDCKVGCDCDRFVEVWNLVFTQFESDGKGNYTPLAKPNIDTGMGLERLACVMQGVDNLFLVDTVANIMKNISQITNTQYGQDEKKDISLRVITDHIRSTVFMISDGVMPSNEGRGYVLRRLLRRAARHGRILGVTEPFLFKVCSTVIKENESAYPQLAEKSEFITKLIKVEEENFSKTIEQGFALLNDIIEDGSVKTLSGADAFKLNDTFGFPIDLVREILAEKGIGVDEEEFYRLLDEQKTRSRNARKNAGADAWLSDTVDITDIQPTEFVGYGENTATAKVLAIIKDGKRETSAFEGETVAVVLNTTPFYAESGGQVGDTGELSSEGFAAAVENTSKNHSGVFLHTATVLNGVLAVGDTLTATINIPRRNAIRRNHTAAHLLQAALRRVLGNHVEQAGQLVNEKTLRFDFTHFSPLTQAEIAQTESIINAVILDALEVDAREMPIADAKKMGATALFGEKYGDVVRVVNVKGFSIELCGGTHVDNTAKLGLFKIRQEGSVAAGVRRIEAVTGQGVLELLRETQSLVDESAAALKLNSAKELPANIQKLAEELRSKDKTIEQLNSKLSGGKVDELFATAKEENGAVIITAKLSGTSSDALHSLCDRALDKAENVLAVFADVTDGKITFACASGKALQQKGVKAGNVVKAVAQIAGGNGGGRPDKAMAGGKDASKVDEALEKVREIGFGFLS